MRPVADDPATVASISRADGLGAVAPAEGAAPTAAAADVAATEALAAAVAAGAVDPALAAERLIAATVAAQRPDGVPAEAWAAIEREVSALLAGDPALADLLAPL
jgi:hypothetical protein